MLLLSLFNVTCLNADEEYEGNSDKPKKALNQRLASIIKTSFQLWYCNYTYLPRLDFRDIHGFVLWAQWNLCQLFFSPLKMTCLTSVLSFAVMSLELKTTRVSKVSVINIFRAYSFLRSFPNHKKRCFLLFQRTAVMTIMTTVGRKRTMTVRTVTTRLKRLAREGRRPLKGKEQQVLLYSLRLKKPYCK